MSAHTTPVASPWDALLTNSIRMKLPASVRSDAIEAFDGVPNGSKAGQVRALLAQCGPLNAASICMVVDIESTSLVGPVMKWDMKLGRVLLEDGKYFLNPRFVEEEAAQVRAAVNLLRKHGYRVKEPS